MCQFKSGIILKNRCYIAQGEDNSSIARDFKHGKKYISEETRFEIKKRR